MRAVGENLLAVVRGQTTMLEHMMLDNMLNDFYVHSLGLVKYTTFLARAASQVVHRYPHMRILEIGKFLHLQAAGIIKKTRRCRYWRRYQENSP